MNFEGFEKLVNSRQSCRNFSNRAVENDKLEKLIKMSLLAPSATNGQPWSFDVVNNPEISANVAKALQDLGLNKFSKDAPAFITVCEERASLIEKIGMAVKDKDYVANDLGIITAHIVLSAQSLGLSTCILGWINQKKLQAALNLPKSKKIHLVIAVGYGDEKNKLRQKKRKPIEKTVRFHF